ncbi:MAG: CRISPR-associated endonuclease Cas1 [Erysipelotrichaceae bacterium]|nr:CRISPR-associated endonuclease Cas1 [Erysipelotrichaceae bacterium]
MLNPLYLYKSGELKRKDNSLVFITEEEEILIPIEQIHTIYCFSDVIVNSRLLQILNKHGIGILFFNYYGNCIGRFLPIHHKNGKLITQHVEGYQDERRRAYIASQIQNAAIQNSCNVLKYYHKKGMALEPLLQELKEMIHEIKDSNHVEDILLLEAKSKKAYYSGFDIILEESPFVFEKRTRKPPENEINAMMSYGYSLLYSTVLAQIDSSRLLPEIAFIHSIERNGPGLHYDLADIYKPVVVDRTILRLIRRREIKLSHFEKTIDGIYMCKEGVQIFLKEFEQVMKSTVTIGHKSYSYRSVIARDIHHLTSYLEGKSGTFEPYIMRW